MCMYIVQWVCVCTLYTVQCTVCISICTLYTLQKLLPIKRVDYAEEDDDDDVEMSSDIPIEIEDSPEIKIYREVWW